jgi:YHS domain-containing protein
MRTSRIVLIALLLAAPAGAQTTAPPEALDGVDPVVLITQGKEVIGKAEFSVARGRFTYLFATAESKAVFEKSPEKYEIQLNGMCARMGGRAGANPADYAVHDGKIYVFGSDECHRKFVAAPEKYLEKPAPAMPIGALDVRRGRELIDRAVKALGGAAALDAITSYVESASQVQKRPNGEATITTKTIWRFPDDVRVERTMSQGDRTFTSGSLLTREGGWFIGQGRVFPQLPDARRSMEAEYGQNLVPLLRDRRSAAFAVAALPPASVDGVAVDRVRVKNGPVDVTLNLAKTGDIHSITFTGRAMEGEVGEYTIVFGDYREVAGLRLPFVERALFDGSLDDSRTRTITSIEINPPLDPALFTPVAK